MSLLYAGRAKKIKNRAVKNRELHAAGSAAAAAAGKSVRQLEAIEHLRRQLAARTAEFERLKAATRAADGTAHENDALRARLRSLGEQNEREKVYFENLLRRGMVDWRHVPAYYGTVATDQGGRCRRHDQEHGSNHPGFESNRRYSASAG